MIPYPASKLHENKLTHSCSDVPVLRGQAPMSFLVLWWGLRWVGWASEINPTWIRKAWSRTTVVQNFCIIVQDLEDSLGNLGAWYPKYCLSWGDQHLPLIQNVSKFLTVSVAKSVLGKKGSVGDTTRKEKENQHQYSKWNITLGRGKTEVDSLMPVSCIRSPAEHSVWRRGSDYLTNI